MRATRRQMVQRTGAVQGLAGASAVPASVDAERKVHCGSCRNEENAGQKGRKAFDHRSQGDQVAREAGNQADDGGEGRQADGEEVHRPQVHGEEGHRAQGDRQAGDGQADGEEGHRPQVDRQALGRNRLTVAGGHRHAADLPARER